MNVYTFVLARTRRCHDGVQTQSPLQLRDIGREDLVVDVVETELALLLSLNYVRRGKLLQMMRDCRLRDLEERMDIRAVQFACHRQLLQYCATLRVR